MSNTTQNAGILPPDEDKTPNTHLSSEYSSDFSEKLYKAMFPWTDRYKDDADGMCLFDDSSLLIDTVLGQVELLRDLGNKIDGNEDIDGFGLVGFADSLVRQLKVLDVVQLEYRVQVIHQKEQQQKIIAELQQTILKMKGGDL